MAEFGENIYDTTEDDINDINDKAHDAKEAYERAKDIYDGLKNSSEAASGTDAAAEGITGAEAAAGAAEGAEAGAAGAGAAAGGEAGAAGTAAGGGAAGGGGAAVAEGGAEIAPEVATIIASPAVAIVALIVAIILGILLWFAYFQALFQSSTGRKYTETTNNQQITKNDSGEFEAENNSDKPDDDPDYKEIYERYGGSPYLKGYLQFIPFLKGSEKVVSSAEGNTVLEGTIKAMNEEKEFPNTVGAFEKAKKLALLDAQAWCDSYQSMSGLGHDCIHGKSNGSLSEGDHCSHGGIEDLKCDGWTSEMSEQVMGQVESAVETLFDDVDYAELLCVLGENEDYNLDNMTEEKFRAIFMGKKATRTNILREYYYLEIRVGHEKYPVYYITYNEDGSEKDRELVEWRYKDVGLVTLERYNLDELYTICSQKQAYDAWYKHEDFNPDSTFYKNYISYHGSKGQTRMTNAEYLEWQEPKTRTYGAYGQTTSDSNFINKDTQDKLFGETKRSERGEIRRRQGFNIADFEYFVTETIDEFVSKLHGFFSGDEDTKTAGGFVENAKNKKILNMYRYINQADEPQASISFGGGTYRAYGCAPSCYIMVGEYYLRQSQDIKTLVNKYSAGGAGIYGSALIQGLGGKSYESAYTGPEKIISEIDAGNPVILSYKGNAGALGNHPKGHYIVIMGYDEYGFYVYDPGDRYNTYGHGGPSECLITYEEFESVSNTFRSVYTFRFENVSMPDFATDSTFDVDDSTVSTVKQALSFYGTGSTAYAMEYAYLTERYGSNFAIGFMANMYQESSGRGGVEQGTGKVISSGSDIQALIDAYNRGEGTWRGLGIHQWTEGRKAGLFEQYKADGLLEKSSITQEDLIASELKYLEKELTGSESGVVSSCDGKSVSECTKIIAHQFERCGTYGSRDNTATNMYQALQRAGVVN